MGKGGGVKFKKEYYKNKITQKRKEVGQRIREYGEGGGGERLI